MTGSHDNNGGRGGSTQVRERSPAELIERAHSVAVDLNTLLALLRESESADAFRVRLAQAHALSLLDELVRLLESRST